MIILLARVFKARHRRHAAVTLLAAFLGFMFLGAWLFDLTQHIPFTSGLYWAITTASTVGYGDITPHNASGRFIASAVMLTCIPLLAATFALLTGAAAASGLRKVLNMATEFPQGSYRLVVGWHPTVPTILDELVKAKDAVVLVADVDPTTVRDEVHVVRGDPTTPAALRKARPDGALHALVTGASDGDVLVSSVLLHEQAPQLSVSALVHSSTVSEALSELGVAETMSADDLVAHTLAKSLETPHAGRLLLKLVGGEDHKLVEIDAAAAEVGQALSQVRDDHKGLVLGLVRSGGVSLGIGDDPVIASGDKLLVAEPFG
ncbi:MAG: ion channel [Acidimicrobiales bacterium]